MAGRVEDGVPKRSVQASMAAPNNLSTHMPQAKARLGRAGTRAGAYAIPLVTET